MQKSVEPFHNHNHDDNDDGPTNEDSHSLEYYCQHGVVFFLHSRFSIILKEDINEDSNINSDDSDIKDNINEDIDIKENIYKDSDIKENINEDEDSDIMVSFLCQKNSA